MIDLGNVYFKSTFGALQEETHKVEEQHGFQELKDNPLYVATKLGLIISECIEALEDNRTGKDSEIRYELADIIIRTMNLAEDLKINLAQAVLDKHEINKTRKFKHGGKLY